MGCGECLRWRSTSSGDAAGRSAPTSQSAADPSAEVVSSRPRECAQSRDVTAAECAVSTGGGAGWRRVGSRSSVTSPAALPSARRVASGAYRATVSGAPWSGSGFRARVRLGARVEGRVRVGVMG